MKVLQGGGDTEFTPADIALFGTTDAANPWRAPYIQTLLELGVDADVIYNPLIADRPWNPDIDGPHEKFQKKEAHNLLFYLGATASGDVSAYSAYELRDLTAQRPTNSTAAILDAQGLRIHPIKQLKQIERDLHDVAPDLLIVRSLGESLHWVTDRLGLGPALGTLALQLIGGRMDAEHGKSLAGFTPEAVAALGREEIAKKAEPHILEIMERIRKNPVQSEHRFVGLGELSVYDEPEKALRRYIIEHFRDLGWETGSNRDGQMYVRRKQQESA